MEQNLYCQTDENFGEEIIRDDSEFDPFFLEEAQ
jgi:hypothetical protein